MDGDTFRRRHRSPEGATLCQGRQAIPRNLSQGHQISLRGVSTCILSGGREATIQGGEAVSGSHAPLYPLPGTAYAVCIDVVSSNTN